MDENNLEILEVENAPEVASPPTSMKVIIREFAKDKVAIVSAVILIILLLVIFIGSLFLDQDKVMTVSIFDKYSPPGELFVLGADQGGRSIMGQLILGARNSILIGFSITIATSIIGIGLGITAGYFGGWVDNIIMRVVDFLLVLPTLMIVIVFVTIIPKYTIWHFVVIMSLFYWTAKARLFRGKALSESRRDYISASKINGTGNLKIMFRELMPNLSSLIIVNLTINFAANIGIETSLSFLGFGLPSNVPSLGTLVSAARSPDVLSTKLWVWLPASCLILVMMLCINYIGQALKRAADSKQRIG